MNNILERGLDSLADAVDNIQSLDIGLLDWALEEIRDLELNVQTLEIELQEMEQKLEDREAELEAIREL